ncbi:tRNA (N6-isopentenyl adenosine(37)-C2)-methylthiotransferase MiaB [Candidatus Omnitrophota bacterium]
MSQRLNKTVFIKTYGCQMNERDSEIICGMMMQEGYAPVQSADEADLIIYNTCSVRKHAEDRVWGNLGSLVKVIGPPSFASAKLSRGATKPKRILGLVGCMGKAYGKEVFRRLPHVDFVCGPANIYDIPEIIDKIRAGKKHIVSIGREKRPMKKGSAAYRDEKIRAFVNIGEGCDNFCSYCIVPHVRGREASRPAKDIIDEIKRLVDAGTKEVTLLGQNVNSYGEKPATKGSPERRRGETSNQLPDFVGLLEEINKIDGLERIRFMTSHPKDVSVYLFSAMRDLKKVCEHLHIPLQSGADRILKLMNRKYTVSHYLGLVDSLRKIIPDVTITTDIIVGFPGESDKDFMDTYMLMKEIKFDSSFIFKYSPRPFTKAADLDDDVPRKIKEERNQSLLILQNDMTRYKNEQRIGSVEEALGLRPAKRKPSASNDLSGFFIKGRTRGNQQVVYKGDKSLIGALSDVKIKDIEEKTLIGELKGAI